MLGKSFLTLDIGVPAQTLQTALLSSLHGEGGAMRTVECTNRRGKRIACKVTINPMHGDAKRGVIVLFEEIPAK